jgi:tetratricopeptide (TPR) repeat protein
LSGIFGPPRFAVKTLLEETSIDRKAHSRFVGREREMAELCSGLEEVLSGRGRFFLVTGEPGIGKSRLTDELLAHAATREMAVLQAGCWEGAGAPTYWPFVQLLRATLGETRAMLLCAENEPQLTEDLAQLIPELRQSLTRAGQSGAQLAPDPEQARFRLFDSVATVFKNLARRQPLAVVIDDLHEADQPSLQMLRFVARQLKNSAVLLIGTCRDAEAQRSPALSQLIGELEREGVHIPLFGLSRENAARLIEELAGILPNPRIVADVHQATAGNPLFIDGVARLLSAAGRLATADRLDPATFRVPSGVREAIRRWLALLSDRSSLAAAATIGQEFELRCLQRVTQVPHDQVLDALREASGVGLVTPLSRGSYAFSHALIRNALSEELSSAERKGLHLKIGKALEELYQADADTHLAELAYHFREGSDINKAIDYSIRAGEAACAVFGYEEAAAHWRTALELMPNSLEDRGRRADLLERLGDLLGLSASEGALQFQCLQGALKLYEELGRLDAAARVQGRVTAWVGTRGWVGDISRALEHSQKAEDFLRRGSEDSSSLLLHLGLAATAGERLSTIEGLAAARQAMEISARLSNEVLKTHATIACANHVFSSGLLAESLALMRQAREKADRLDDAIAGFGSARVICYMMTSLYDPIEGEAWVRRELARPRIAQASLLQRQLLDQLGMSQVVAGKLAEALVQSDGEREPFLKGQIAFYRGEWQVADLVLSQAFDQARQDGRRTFVCIYGAWLAKVRRVVGQHSSAEAILREILDISIDGPHVPFEVNIRQELALLTAQTGCLDQAHLHLARCLEVMAAGEDWRGLAGHVVRAEAVVAAAESRFEVAHKQFASAVEIHRRYQVPFEEADTLHYWGRALLAAGEHVGARDKLGAAIELYQRHGAGEPWLERVRPDQSLAKVASPIAEVEPALAPPMSPLGRSRGQREGETVEDPSPRGVFRKEGDYWTLSGEGPEFRLRDAKGLRYVAHLLAHPGQEFAAQDLVSAIEGGGSPSGTGNRASHCYVAGTTTIDLGDAGDRLDARAKVEYQRRLAELHEELELAEQHNDLGRVDKARKELDFIRHQIAASVGLRGRDRKVASHAERARLMVTKAIKSALQRIRQADPELGRHLGLSIQTGYFCSYVPRPSTTTWRL